MCLIVDTNVAHRVLADPENPEFGPVRSALYGTGRRAQKLVYGGALASEYQQSGRIMRRVLTLERAGKAWRENDEAVETETARITPQCKSNDPHIIALARVSGVRLLCTHDRRSGLMADFKNGALLDRPRGKVYTRRANSHLLAEDCPCRRCRGGG